MTLLALRTLLSRVPAMAWTILFVVVFLVVAVVGIERHGERVGVRKIARKAVTDSVKTATAAVDTATHRANTAHGLDQQAGRRRQQLRAQIELVDSGTVRIGDSLLAAPLPLIQLVHRDDEKIAADSVTIGALLAERTTREARDTVVAHREAIETASDDGGGISFKEIAVVVAIVEALHQLARLLGR